MDSFFYCVLCAHTICVGGGIRSVRKLMDPLFTHDGSEDDEEAGWAPTKGHGSPLRTALTRAPAVKRALFPIPEELQASAKRQRLQVYDGLMPRDDVAKSAFVVQLASWLASNHGVFLCDPISGERKRLTLPSRLVPYDMLPALFASAPQSVFRLPTLKHPDFESEKDEVRRCELTNIVGTQSQAIFLGAIYALANMLPVVDSGHTLRCIKCQANASCRTLLTIAEEMRATCFHPHVSNPEQSTCWAAGVDGNDLYSSRPAEAKGCRSGEAICMVCLYEDVIFKDEELIGNLSLWHSLETSFYSNIISSQEHLARRFCACSPPDGGVGNLCLFRFSRVLDADTEGIKDFTIDVTVPEMFKELRRDVALVDYGFDTVRDGTVLRSILMETSTVLKPFASLERLETYQHLAQPPPPPIPMPVVSLPLSNPFKAAEGVQPQPKKPPQPQPQQQPLQARSTGTETERFEHLKALLPSVREFHATLKTLVAPLKITMTQDDPLNVLDYCKSCGAYGHPQIKTCPFCSNKKVKVKNGRAEHFADNAATYVASSADISVKLVENSMRDIERHMELLEIAVHRCVENQPYFRGGPSAAFIGYDPSIDVRSRRTPPPTLTPTAPFLTVAAVPRDMMEKTLEISFFWNSDYLKKVIATFSQGDYATGDLYDLLAWSNQLHTSIANAQETLNPSQRKSVDTYIETENYKQRVLDSLHAFLQKRLYFVNQFNLGKGDSVQLYDTIIQLDETEKQQQQPQHQPQTIASGTF